MKSKTDREKDAARQMWWALNSLIPCVAPSRVGHEINLSEARSAMKAWLKVDPNIEDQT